MSASVTYLSDRRLLEIGGEDRVGFLQGLITNDVEKLAEGEGRFAALLSPQGKILFDFFVVRRGEVFLIDCPASSLDGLSKRLGLYRLRAKVTIAEASHCAFAAWGNDAAAWAKESGGLAYVDPRLPQLGFRGVFPASGEPAQTASLAEYEAMRIEQGVPEGGKDYIYGDAFPHDACLDLLRGVSFQKGCFVGQEVVARMQHRGTARTRVLSVSATEPLPHGGADILAGGFAVGRLGSVAEHRGVALARLDRVRDALLKGQSFSASGIDVSLSVPAWANYILDASLAGAPS